MAEAVDEVTDELLHVLQHESTMTQRWVHLNEVFGVIKDTLGTKSLTAQCAFQEEIDRIEDMLFEDANPEDDERTEMQDTLDKHRKDVQTRASADYGVLYFGFLLSDVGIKTARQTFITEFFKHPSIAVEEDADMEGDIEMEDDTEMNVGAEMEADAEVEACTEKGPDIEMEADNKMAAGAVMER